MLANGRLVSRPFQVQVLRVEALELYPTVRARDQAQTGRHNGQGGNLHAKCLFTGRATGKRVGALHNGISLSTSVEGEW